MPSQSLVDFSSIPLIVNTYDGAAEKYAADYEGERYLLKFGKILEPNPKNPMQASYANVPVNEYIGSKVIASLGIETQEVLLGVHQGRSVVACKDFIRSRGTNFELIEFNKLETSMHGGSSSGRSTPELGFTMKVLRSHPALENIRHLAISRFWNTLIADALIGNFDRHSGNWGYILDSSTMTIVDLAPVYDCGSALYARLSEKQMEKYIQDEGSLAQRVRSFPTVKLLVNGKKPRYDDFLLSDEGKNARKALLRLMPQINFSEIDSIVEATPGISDTRKAFYKTLMRVRRNTILKPAYELAQAEFAAKQHPSSHCEKSLYAIAAERVDIADANQNHQGIPFENVLGKGGHALLIEAEASDPVPDSELFE